MLVRTKEPFLSFFLVTVHRLDFFAYLEQMRAKTLTSFVLKERHAGQYPAPHPGWLVRQQWYLHAIFELHS